MKKLKFSATVTATPGVLFVLALILLFLALSDIAKQNLHNLISS